MKNIESNFTQEIVLPSNGLLNPELQDGRLIQRCMMVSDQKFLSGSTMTAGAAIQQLLQRTIESPEEFDVKKLTLPDTLFLLFKLRILSYGNMYTFKTRCPECGERISVTLDLSELPVEFLEEGFAETLVAKLPHRGDKVYTKLLTNQDIDEIDKELKRRKRKSMNTEEGDYVLRIVKSIEKIELSKPNADNKSELTHPIDIERYVNSLTDLDASAIIAARDSVRFGVIPAVEYTCPECSNYIDVNIQFSSEFFRPQFN